MMHPLVFLWLCVLTVAVAWLIAVVTTKDDDL